jgi:hypothetical protein
VLQAHAVLGARDRQEFGWRLMVAYLAFGREDAALGIVNDVLEDLDRRKPADRALAVDCLSVLLLQLAPDPAARSELTPYIAEFAALAHRAVSERPDDSLGLVASHLLDPAFGLQIDEHSRGRLREIVDVCAAEVVDVMPVRLGEIAASLSTSAPEGFAVTARSIVTTFAEADGDAPASEESVRRREAELRQLEAQVGQVAAGSRVEQELAAILADLNARQLQELLRVGDLDGATRRAYRLFREPRITSLMGDAVRGATLFLMLTRARLADDTLASPAFYNSDPVRLIRQHFAEKLVLGPLDNQLLPFLARNLDFVRPLAAELLLLYARRPQTHESAVALMLTLGELIFDRMAWKVQELARTKRRVDDETGVLLSEYEKVVFDQGYPAVVPGRVGQLRSVAHRRLRLRMSDHVGRPHRFAPRLIVDELRQDLGVAECLVTFRLDRNGLWLGLVRAEQRPVVMKLCDHAPAASAIAAHREDARTGAIQLWSATDYAWFGDTVLTPLGSVLAPEVERLIVVGSQVDVPLHAAYVRGGGYAIERYAVMYEQSRRSLAANRARQHVPVSRLALVAYEGRGQRRLRQVEAEVASITSAVESRLVKRRPSASCRSARTALKAEDIDAVHFSGHMRDPIDAAGWCLQLRDGELDCLGVLRPLAGRLRLVVLMACSAGATMTRSRSLEAGFPHALVALGTCAVIAPRRPIADPVAAAFSGTFYAQLAVSTDVPEAFRHSVAGLIEGHRPGVWSALALHGR